MKLTVYSRRWSHTDDYTVEITDHGWHISHMAHVGDCAATGEPTLFDNFRQDHINYPVHLGSYMEYLWTQAQENWLSEEEIQRHLDVLGEWIQTVEKASPGGLWLDYSW